MFYYVTTCRARSIPYMANRIHVGCELHCTGLAIAIRDTKFSMFAKQQAFSRHEDMACEWRPQKPSLMTFKLPLRTRPSQLPLCMILSSQFTDVHFLPSSSHFSSTTWLEFTLQINASLRSMTCKHPQHCDPGKRSLIIVGGIAITIGTLGCNLVL